MHPTHHRVVIVGGGCSGLGVAIRLLAEGIRDFVLLEKAEQLGGTWRENTYPGCACDVPSQLYSFSFAPSNDWSRVFAEQPEIQRYLLRSKISKVKIKKPASARRLFTLNADSSGGHFISSAYTIQHETL